MYITCLWQQFSAAICCDLDAARTLHSPRFADAGYHTHHQNEGLYYVSDTLHFGKRLAELDEISGDQNTIATEGV